MQVGKNDGIENCVKVHEGKYRDELQNSVEVETRCHHQQKTPIAPGIQRCNQCGKEQSSEQWRREIEGRLHELRG